MIITLLVLNQEINMHMTFKNAKDIFGINHRYIRIDSASECEMCLSLCHTGLGVCPLPTSPSSKINRILCCFWLF